MASDLYDLEQYVSGKCMYLAAALHRATGWEIQAAIEPAMAGYSRYVGHAWCVDPETGHCVDIDGAYPAKVNGWLHPENLLMPKMDENILYAVVAEGSPDLSRTKWDSEVTNALLVVQSFLLPKLSQVTA